MKSISSTISIPSNKEEVKMSRKVGKCFGIPFALPMTLAGICLVKRNPDWFLNGVSDEVLGVVLSGTKALEIPPECSTDDSILTDMACNYTKAYPEVGQMIRLMRALVKHWDQ